MQDKYLTTKPLFELGLTKDEIKRQTQISDKTYYNHLERYKNRYKHGGRHKKQISFPIYVFSLMANRDYTVQANMCSVGERTFRRYADSCFSENSNLTNREAAAKVLYILGYPPKDIAAHTHLGLPKCMKLLPDIASPEILLNVVLNSLDFLYAAEMNSKTELYETLAKTINDFCQNSAEK